MSGNDDLEERKQGVWSMDEVRSSSADSSGTSDNSDTSETSDTVDPSGTKDQSDAGGSDTSDGFDSEDASVAADTAVGNSVRAMSKDASRKDLAVRDLHNVNVYLYEEIYREMVATFKDLDSEYFAEHGEELSKNKEFFNAVFRAGLQSPQIREELGLKDE